MRLLSYLDFLLPKLVLMRCSVPPLDVYHIFLFILISVVLFDLQIATALPLFATSSAVSSPELKPASDSRENGETSLDASLCSAASLAVVALVIVAEAVFVIRIIGTVLAVIFLEHIKNLENQKTWTDLEAK